MTALLILLIANSAYLAALPAANLFYIANIPLHLVLGAAVCSLANLPIQKIPKIIPLLLATLIGIYLIPAGATTDHYKILWAHIALAAIGLALIKPRYTLALATLDVLRRSPKIRPPQRSHRQSKNRPRRHDRGRRRPALPLLALLLPHQRRRHHARRTSSWNPQQCGECHKDIYEQWKSSMHHFASFNNQFYKATILHMQELSGTQGSKWCAACHDHAVFFNGRFEIPIKQQVDTPEAQNGLGCVSCHSITHVGSTMGNSDFVMMYPPLHRLASSKNAFIQASEKFLTYSKPRAASPHLHESLHARAVRRVLLRLPQSPSRSARQSLPLDPRIQRLR